VPQFATVTHPDLPGVEVQMAKARNGWKPKKAAAKKAATPKTARPEQTAEPDSPTAGPSTTTEKDKR
jgi:hypothetical protein